MAKYLHYPYKYNHKQQDSLNALLTPKCAKKWNNSAGGERARLIRTAGYINKNFKKGKLTIILVL